jgi:hypothetical protein
MGYTHYWENSATVIPVEAILIIREIVEQAYADGVIQVEHNRKGLPIVTERLIRFNGVDDLGHETFRFDVDDVYRTDRGTAFAFCKTNQKPYDTVVMKVLIVLKWALKELITIRSDGSFSEEWQDVRDEMSARYAIHTSVNEALTVA